MTRKVVALNAVAGVDAYAPREIAARVKEFCIVKAHLPLLSLTMLGVLAGAFIGLGLFLIAVLGFLFGLLLAYLIELHRRYNAQWNW